MPQCDGRQFVNIHQGTRLILAIPIVLPSFKHSFQTHSDTTTVDLLPAVDSRSVMPSSKRPVRKRALPKRKQAGEIPSDSRPSRAAPKRRKVSVPPPTAGPSRFEEQDVVLTMWNNFLDQPFRCQGVTF